MSDKNKDELKIDTTKYEIMLHLQRIIELLDKLEPKTNKKPL